MSGEALISTHSSGCWPEIAIEDCVRGNASMVPLRTPEQLRQLQFHWGNPPPAADPSTVIFTIQRKSPRSARAFVYSRRKSAIRNVHRDFHTETQIDRTRGFPSHDALLDSELTFAGRSEPSAGIDPCAAWIQPPGQDHEWRLMIFMNRAVRLL